MSGVAAGAATYLAFDIGGTKIASGFVTLPDENSAHADCGRKPRVEAQCEIPTEASRGGDDIRERLTAFASRQLARARDEGAVIRGIGIAAAGVPDSRTGVIVSATDILPGWRGQRIYDAFAKVTDLPVHMVGDVGAHGLGEAGYGAGRGHGIVLSIGVLYVPQIARIVRANIISEYGKDYVRAVIVSGARAPWILFKHVTRNIAAPVMVFTTLSVADAIVFEASLSFINAGIPEPTPTWGNILSSAKAGVIFGYWWQAMFPGLAIMITVLCLNILSEGITDAMVAAPTAPVTKSAADAEAERREDRLLTDPVAAYREQAESLADSLAALKEAELKRTDRFEPTSTAAPVIEVKNLCIKFPRHGDVNVVDHVSFAVRPGETMGLVGESGCGKSITSLAIMGLLDPKAEISGEILFGGRNLVGMSPKEHNALRGHEIAMVYQDALSSLNPSMLIKSQMKQLTSRGGTRSAEELLELVGLDPKRTLESYPHELSGGQRQRVLIAMALTRDPKLIIADEPTTALDVTVQKQVIDLLNELREKLGFAMIFVSHDLALVAKVAHSITVMYAGQVVEQGSTKEILTDPRHEYTRGLLGSVTSIEAGAKRLHQVPGTVPSPADFPKGDRFAPRSSHPDVGLNTRPIFERVPGTHHYYAALPADADVTPAAATVSTQEGGAR